MGLLVYWGLTPQQQPGSYQGGEMMMMKSVFLVEETGGIRQVTDETFIRENTRKVQLTHEWSVYRHSGGRKRGKQTSPHPLPRGSHCRKRGEKARRKVKKGENIRSIEVTRYIV